MRWFKHLALSAEDVRMSALLDEHGAEGYGVYWLIIERLAFVQDSDSDFSEFCEYSERKWSRICHVSPKKLRKTLSFLENAGLLLVEYNQKVISLKSPNLVKYKDEYSRRRSKKIAENTDSVRIVSGQCTSQDRDTDIDTHTEGKNPLTPKPKTGIATRNSDVVEVFEYWKSMLAKRHDTILNEKRRRKIKNMLVEPYSVDRLKCAIAGSLLSPWNMGDNPDEKVYDDLVTILRDGVQVERLELLWITYQEKLPGGRLPVPRDLAALKAALRNAGMKYDGGRNRDQNTVDPFAD